MDKKRYYNFNLVIYEDDKNFKDQMKAIQEEKDAIWIRHGQDVNEDTGELKKPHYHIVLKLKNACTISALAKRIFVEENMIEMVKKSLNGCLKYLIHYGNDNKYQYNKELVLSNNDKLLRRFLELVTKDVLEVEKVITIQEFIENFPDFIKISVLSKYAQKHNMWDAFRRNYSIIKDLANEHNGKMSGELYGWKHSNPDYYTSRDEI